MQNGDVLLISRQAMEVALMVVLPLLAVSLFIGIAVSVFQAATSIQEMTLTFVPKLLGFVVMIFLLGNWMLTTLVGFTHLCFERIAHIQSY